MDDTKNVSPSSAQDPLRQIFAVHFRPGPAWVDDKASAEQLLGAHDAYWADLVESGRAVFEYVSFESKGGAAFFFAADEATAQLILADDPAITSGLVVAETGPWRTRSQSPPAPETSQPGDPETNAMIIRKLFLAVENRDPVGVLGAYDPAIEIHEAPSLPYGGVYKGHQGAFQHATGYRAAWDGLQAENERSLGAEVLAAGDRVMVFWTQKGRVAATNQNFAMPVVSVYRMEAGRVIESRMFHFDVAATRDFLNACSGTAGRP